jgi:hypothetical protein
MREEWHPTTNFDVWNFRVRISHLILILLTSFLIHFGSQPSVGTAQESVDLLIVGGQVFQTESGTFEANAGLAIQDGKFIAFDLTDGLPNAKELIELEDGKFILPGIVDCHAHYNVKLIKKRREEFKVMPIIYLANGATVTFSCGEYAPEEMYRLRRRIESGEQSPSGLARQNGARSF